MTFILQLRIELNIVPTADNSAYKCCLFSETGSEICSTARVYDEFTINTVAKQYLLCNTPTKSVIASRIADDEGMYTYLLILLFFNFSTIRIILTVKCYGYVLIHYEQCIFVHTLSFF